MTPPIIENLCERYARNLSNYHSSSYNEAQLRQEFLNPFFKALGWDMENEQGYAEAYKDVVHEDSIRDEDSTKAPDYSFRIGGTRKFFLEAKKPLVFVRDDPKPAFQLRRYAWSAKLPLSILTNFEEFAVYDCRWRPMHDDKPGKHRIQYVKFEEYAAKWDEIAAVFSREAVLKGSFDKYAQEQKGKRGTQGVDDEFLQDIELFREDLARNIHLRNKELALSDLNFAVGKTIDRLLFLRVCEDRGIEEYGQIKALLKGEDVYARLTRRFHEADERYNSGLFHFKADKERSEQPDRLTPGLAADDKILKEIIKRLYYPESPYEFSVMPADILGQVYEQFLGKVIVKAGRTVDVEYKPEVKKAGGVYYTPTYIVDYIVKHTVGKLLEGKTPKEVETLRVLDPACGSGSFLIGAYQYLLDWHLEHYLKQFTPPSPPAKAGGNPNFPPTSVGGQKGGMLSAKASPPTPPAKAGGKGLPVYQSARGEWRLTLAERKKILLNNIYGVDIDAQAVEVTKLSLLLKVLEGESTDTVQGELKLRHHALPDLGNNIKCGNSLIGPDILKMSFPPTSVGGHKGGMFVAAKSSPPIPPAKARGESKSPSVHGGTKGGSGDLREKGGRTLTDEEISRINPFDWQREFPSVFKAGGFDAVIGNPPYVRQETLGHQFKDYAKSKFEVYNGIADLYTYFIEQSHCLLKTGGRFGMICSNKWIRADYGSPLRNFIAEKTAIEELVDFDGLGVFKTAITYPVIILTASHQVEKQNFVYALVRRLNFESLRKEVSTIGLRLDERAISGSNWTLSDSGVLNIFEKMKAVGVPLGKYVNQQIYYGVKTGFNEAFIIDGETRKRLIKADKKNANLIKPFAMGRDVKRYGELGFSYLILLPKGWTARTRKDINAPEKWLAKTYPALYEHLSNYRAKAIKRQDQGDYWWELRACEYYNAFEKPKIVFPTIQNRAHFTIDRDGVYSNDKTTIITPADNYLLGLINSLLLDFFFKQIASTKQGGFYEYKPMYISQLPIRTINFSEKTDKARHDRMVSLVEKMLEMNRRLPSEKSPVEREKIERQIAATDRQIDELVYELYGLTEEEIAIVEGKGQQHSPPIPPTK